MPAKKKQQAVAAVAKRQALVAQAAAKKQQQQQEDEDLLLLELHYERMQRDEKAQQKKGQQNQGTAANLTKSAPNMQNHGPESENERVDHQQQSPPSKTAGQATTKDPSHNHDARNTITATLSDSATTFSSLERKQAALLALLTEYERSEEAAEALARRGGRVGEGEAAEGTNDIEEGERNAAAAGRNQALFASHDRKHLGGGGGATLLPSSLHESAVVGNKHSAYASARHILANLGVSLGSFYLDEGRNKANPNPSSAAEMKTQIRFGADDDDGVHDKAHLNASKFTSATATTTARGKKGGDVSPPELDGRLVAAALADLEQAARRQHSQQQQPHANVGGAHVFRKEDPTTAVASAAHLPPQPQQQQVAAPTTTTPDASPFLGGGNQKPKRSTPTPSTMQLQTLLNALARSVLAANYNNNNNNNTNNNKVPSAAAESTAREHNKNSTAPAGANHPLNMNLMGTAGHPHHHHQTAAARQTIVKLTGAQPPTAPSSHSLHNTLGGLVNNKPAKLTSDDAIASTIASNNNNHNSMTKPKANGTKSESSSTSFLATNSSSHSNVLLAQAARKIILARQQQQQQEEEAQKKRGAAKQAAAGDVAGGEKKAKQNGNNEEGKNAAAPAQAQEEESEESVRRRILTEALAAVAAKERASHYAAKKNNNNNNNNNNLDVGSDNKNDDDTNTSEAEADSGSTTSNTQILLAAAAANTKLPMSFKNTSSSGEGEEDDQSFGLSLIEEALLMIVGGGGSKNKNKNPDVGRPRVRGEGEEIEVDSRENSNNDKHLVGGTQLAPPPQMARQRRGRKGEEEEDEDSYIENYIKNITSRNHPSSNRKQTETEVHALDEEEEDDDNDDENRGLGIIAPELDEDEQFYLKKAIQKQHLMKILLRRRERELRRKLGEAEEDNEYEGDIQVEKRRGGEGEGEFFDTDGEGFEDGDENLGRLVGEYDFYDLGEEDEGEDNYDNNFHRRALGGEPEEQQEEKDVGLQLLRKKKNKKSARYADGEVEEDEEDDDNLFCVDRFDELLAEKLRLSLGGSSARRNHNKQQQQHARLGSRVEVDKGFKTVTFEGKDAAKGRGLVATRDFPSRTVVTSCKPDIAVLYSSHVKTHCASCYRSLVNTAAAASSPPPPAAGAGTDADQKKKNGDETDSGGDHLGGEAGAETNKLQRGGQHNNTQNHDHHHQHRFGSGVGVKISGGTFGGGSPALKPPYFVCEFCFNFALCEDCNAASAWDAHCLPCRWFSTLPPEVQENDTDYIRFLLNYCARIQGGDRRLMYAVETLCSNEEAQRENVKKFCSSYSKLVATTFAPQGLLVSQQHLYETLLRTKSNAIGFPFDSSATLGWAVQLDVCMVNHSCHPNCAITQAPNGLIELRALRPIFKGEEITIAYINIPAFPDVRTRVAHLWSEYRFKCGCDLCEEQTKTLITSGGTMPKLLP